MSDSGSTTGTPITTSGATEYNDFVPNSLPLEVWRKIIGYNPWHFWGLANSSQVPVRSDCNAIVLQYAWQNSDAVGRNEIRNSIVVAEARLREYLNYSIGQRWVVEEYQYPRPEFYAQQYGGSIGSDGRWLSIRASEGYIRNMGVQTRTAIDTAASVVYSDEDGDGLNETFTVTVATTVTDTDQIALYFGADDRLDDELVNEKWRIAPIKVSIDPDAGTATIKGRAWMLVKPILHEGYNTAVLLSGIDPSVSSNFVSTVAVYRHYTDPTGTTEATAQALLVWETEPYPRWAISCINGGNLSFSTNSRDPAAFAYGISRAQIRDDRLGEVTVGRANYDADSGEWIGVDWGTCRQPDRVILRYETGVKLISMENTLLQSRLPGRWDEIVARLASAELTQRICACDTANRELYRWQHDLALDSDANLSDRQQNNPFGTRQGGIYAWERVKQLNTTQSFVLR